MALVFLVNRLDELKPDQTTTHLIQASRRLRDDVCVANVGDLEVLQDRVLLRGRRVSHHDTSVGGPVLAEAPPDHLLLGPGDQVWIRTNPARDLGRAGIHGWSLDVLELATEHGVEVLNRPAGLRLARTKLYTSRLPAGCAPHTWISQDVDALLAYAHDSGGPTVAKPVQGTQGRGVLLLRQEPDPNQRAMLELLTSEGPVVIQRCVPGADQGDLRVLMLNGQILEQAGAIAAVHRRPASGGFRSNVHTGGTPSLGVLTAEQRLTCERVGPRIHQDGLAFVGLDLIGDQVIEVNAWSPGGLPDIERFTGVDFTTRILADLVA